MLKQVLYLSQLGEARIKNVLESENLFNKLRVVFPAYMHNAKIHARGEKSDSWGIFTFAIVRHPFQRQATTTL